MYLLMILLLLLLLLLLLTSIDSINIFNNNIHKNNKNTNKNTIITLQNKMNTTITPTPINANTTNTNTATTTTTTPINTTIKVLKILSYFLAWYTLTIVYNISSKKVLNIFPLPATISLIQLVIGIPLFLPIWLYKLPMISLSYNNIIQYIKISLYHCIGNYTTLLSLYSGAISFTHIIKASEPIFSAILSIIIFKTILPLYIYITLIPIVFGVALASSNELSFTWISFFSAMASNLFYQLRIVLAKKQMTTTTTTNNNNTTTTTKNIDKTLSKMENNTITIRNNDDNISPENLYRIITIISSILLIPIALLLEGSLLSLSYNNIIKNNNYNEFISSIIISGISYYIYNEIAFWILGLVNPISHAVGNTIKRVVIIFASIILLRTPISLQGIIGSIIAILGTLTYSLVLYQYEKQQKLKQQN